MIRINKNVVKGLMPVISMVMVQIAYAVMNILYKMGVEDGMSMRILIAYRMAFASAFMVFLALLLERKKMPKFTWLILFQAFLCGLFGGCLFQILYVEGLALSSATFAVAIYNLSPAVTLIMAIIFGLEKLALPTVVGKAKVVGLVLGFGGAMLFTFYKGVEIKLWSTHIDLFHHHESTNSHVASSSNMVLGASLCLGSSICYALWLIIQTKMNKMYPCFYSSTALMSVIGTILSGGFALCLERDWQQWKLGWNIRLLIVSYSGIVTSGLLVVVISWATQVRGPFFVSVFSPLTLVLVALAGTLVLDEKLHLGSILGGLLIVCGLYIVMWAKTKEMNAILTTQVVPSTTSSQDQSQHDHHSDHKIEIVDTTTPQISNNNNENITRSFTDQRVRTVA
ncbi:WAT1-related protein [Quillaja saponaria]|uniref:WAT1-related protein n=1 Tax=Quillaja saponaria TaxID=32244 RepID=A0AAD7L2S7_QUISA|nr:WAT1-related protein [Quillaja saponaria]